MTDVKKYAERYAAQGWQVFPVKPKDKLPLGKWADIATSTNAADLFAGNENIGIATGARSGLVVLDVDFGHGGEETLAALTAVHGTLPDTPIAKTGGGGRHILFAHPGFDIRNSAGKLGKGLDIRGDGGYIVAPPSLHPSGARYEWDMAHLPSSTPLAHMPQWMIDKLTTDIPASPTAAPDGDAFGAGSRNQTLASLAGTMRRRGMSLDAITTALLAENKAKCVPPLPEREVRQIAESVTRYEPTAAPKMTSRTRLSQEWAFVKSIYEFNHAAEFGWLSPDMFFDPALSEFWKRVQSGETTSFAASAAGIITELAQVQVDVNAVDAYANAIMQQAYLDGVAKTAAELQRLALAGDGEKSRRVIEALAEQAPHAKVSAKTAAEGLAEFVAGLTGENAFIRTHVLPIDNIIGGLKRKDLSILAARPSVGKTTLAWQMARNAAAAGNRVLYLALEPTAANLWGKAALGIVEVTEDEIANRKAPAGTLERVTGEIIPELSARYESLFVFDDPPYTMSALWRVTAQVQPDLVFIDHLDFIEHQAENTVARLGEISKWGKRMAKKLDCHVCFVHQLSRDLEKRENKKPQMSDLRDSGHLEQDADVVLMPYRPDYHDQDSPVKPRYSETLVYIRKNRNGKIGTAGLYMDMRQQWFYRRDEIDDAKFKERL